MGRASNPIHQTEDVMIDYSDKLTGMCQSMDGFLKECNEVSEKMEMEATSGVYIKGGRLEYSISWSIKYNLRHLNRSISTFIPTHLNHLASKQPLRKNLLDPIRNHLAHRFVDGLSLTHEVFKLCLNQESSFNIFFLDNKPRLMIEYAKNVVGSRNPKIEFKQACFFDTWEENLKFAVRQAVEHEMFTVENFDKQSELVQFFVKQSCENLPFNNKIRSHILKQTLLDHVGENISAPNTGISKRKI